MTKPKSRLPESPKDVFDDEIVKAFQLTTVEQREAIARDFEKGRLDTWHEFDHIGTLPVALLVASLVDADSPLAFNGRMKLKKPTMLELALLITKLEPLSTIAHSSVDNSPKTVDKSVEKSRISVDNLFMPVDKIGVFS